MANVSAGPRRSIGTALWPVLAQDAHPVGKPAHCNGRRRFHRAEPRLAAIAAALTIDVARHRR